MLLELYDSGTLLCVAEQNNGYLCRSLWSILSRRRDSIRTSQLLAVNTLGPAGRPLFIHSGTYEQLLEVFGLAPAQLAETIARKVGS